MKRTGILIHTAAIQHQKEKGESSNYGGFPTYFVGNCRVCQCLKLRVFSRKHLKRLVKKWL